MTLQFSKVIKKVTKNGEVVDTNTTLLWDRDSHYNRYSLHTTASEHRVVFQFSVPIEDPSDTEAPRFYLTMDHHQLRELIHEAKKLGFQE